MTDKAAAAIREFCQEWCGLWDKTNSYLKPGANFPINHMISDLTALIEEHYVAKEEHEKLVNAALQNKPQPTAEDAEEILEKHFHATPYKLNIAQHRLALFAMHEFATLHAHRIAEKMVEEKLREELIAYDKWLNRTRWGMREVLSPEKAVERYLKSKEQ